MVWSNTKTVCPRTVTHLSTNPARNFSDAPNDVNSKPNRIALWYDQIWLVAVPTAVDEDAFEVSNEDAVSYTHLTLPTNREV